MIFLHFKIYNYKELMPQIKTYSENDFVQCYYNYTITYVNLKDPENFILIEKKNCQMHQLDFLVTLNLFCENCWPTIN